MSFNPRSQYNTFPTYQGQPDYSPASLAIAEGVLELLQAKYNYIRPQDHSRPFPAYELHAVLNRPSTLPVEVTYFYKQTYQLMPTETRLIVLGELAFYAEAATFLTHLYHETHNCTDHAPYSFEAVLEYANPNMIERLWTVLDLVILANYHNPDRPCIHMQDMRTLGTVQSTQRVGSLQWDGQWNIVQQP